MRVHEVGSQRPQRPREPHREHGIEVARRRQPLERHGQLGVERLQHAGRIVQPDEGHVDAALPKRRQQRQQMPLGPADPADPVDVDDLHGTVRGGGARRAASRDARLSTATLATSASRKSHGTR